MTNLNIQTVTIALAPAFAISVGIQHSNELLDALFSTLSGSNNNLKKLWMGLSSLVFGCVATVGFKLDIVGALGGIPSTPGAVWVLNVVVTALIISTGTGTEGINSIVKFLGYAKDQKKAAAGSSEANAGTAAMNLVNREP